MSYVTVDDAIVYFAKKLHTEVWDDASNEKRTKALSHATLILDRLNYTGAKTAPLQPEEWPRYGNLTVPLPVQYACAELAISLLDGVDPDLELKNLSNTKEEFGQVKSTFDRTQMTEHILAGVPSITAWRLVLPYLRDNRSVSLVRAN